MSGVQSGSVVFDQKEMRKHLHDCLEQGRLLAFPATRQRRAATSTSLRKRRTLSLIKNYSVRETTITSMNTVLLGTTALVNSVLEGDAIH